MDFQNGDFKQLTKQYKQLAKDYNKFLGDFLMKQGEECLADTKRNTPVDTGRLRNSWQLSGPFKDGNDRYVVVHNNVKYASWVEDGHIQRERFLPIGYLNSPKGKQLANSLKAKYGSDTKGVMLKNKWIKGRHMARTALTRIELKIPQRFEQEFAEWCKGKGIS